MASGALTLVIPSNRPLDHAKPAIESAIRFTEARGHRLVISDNSGDRAKAAWLAGLPALVTVLPDGPPSAGANLMAALAEVKTPFVMPMGDDDRIEANAGEADPDWFALPANVVALRPEIRVTTLDGSLIRSSRMVIDQADPAGRMMAYASGFGGDNASYYSAWRTEILVPLLALFCQHHPTGAGTGDWPIVLAGLAEGLMLGDPSTLFHYALGHWQTTQAIAEARAALLAKAGLPAAASRMVTLFHHADCHVYFSRSSSRLNQAERLACIRTSAVMFLRPIARQIHQNPADWPEASGLAGPFIEVLSRSEPDVSILFKMTTTMLDRLKPGLKEGYDRFLEAARSHAPAPLQP